MNEKYATIKKDHEIGVFENAVTIPAGTTGRIIDMINTDGKILLQVEFDEYSEFDWFSPEELEDFD